MQLSSQAQPWAKSSPRGQCLRRPLPGSILKDHPCSEALDSSQVEDRQSGEQMIFQVDDPSPSVSILQAGRQRGLTFSSLIQPFDLDPPFSFSQGNVVNSKAKSAAGIGTRRVRQCPSREGQEGKPGCFLTRHQQSLTQFDIL
jgi:hypothetical protein